MAYPVLFLIQHLHRGGTEHHLYELVTGLDHTVIEPHVVHLNDAHCNVALMLDRHPEVRRTCFPMERIYSPSGLRAISQVRGYVRRNRIAAVVTYHFAADFIGALSALGMRRTALISSRRDVGFQRTSRQVWLGRHFMARRVDRYLAVSGAVGEALSLAEGINPRRIETIYNGIDLNAMKAEGWDPAAERARLGLAPDELVLACIANFNPVKRHVDLIDAFAQMKSELPDLPLRLLLVGEGPMRAAIEARIAEKKLGASVLLPGHSSQVGREITLCDIFVLPSETEGQSNSILQAMGYAKPVVACRAGGNPETVEDGVTALLVPPRNPPELQGALSRLARDPDLRRVMGEAGRRRVEQLFTHQMMIEKTQAMIVRLIENRR